MYYFIFNFLFGNNSVLQKSCTNSTWTSCFQELNILPHLPHYSISTYYLFLVIVADLMLLLAKFLKCVFPKNKAIFLCIHYIKLRKLTLI